MPYTSLFRSRDPFIEFVLRRLYRKNLEPDDLLFPAVSFLDGRVHHPLARRPDIGTGPDIWAASERVMDAAVEKAYGGKKKIVWFEVFAVQAAKDKFDEWVPRSEERRVGHAGRRLDQA